MYVGMCVRVCVGVYIYIYAVASGQHLVPGINMCVRVSVCLSVCLCVQLGAANNSLEEALQDNIVKNPLYIKFLCVVNILGH
jgi:hypothetical protein